MWIIAKMKMCTLLNSEKGLLEKLWHWWEYLVLTLVIMIPTLVMIGSGIDTDGTDTGTDDISIGNGQTSN